MVIRTSDRVSDAIKNDKGGMGWDECPRNE